jgi:hypothetical protein
LGEESVVVAGDAARSSLHVCGDGETMSSGLLEMELDVPDEQVHDLGLVIFMPVARPGEHR